MSYSPPERWIGVFLFYLALILALLTWPLSPTAEPSGDRWAVCAAFVGVVVVIHVFVYIQHPYRPSRPHEGWENFWDQGQYVLSARALSRGDLQSSQHFYPIGYAALAAPFVYLTPRDPFAVVNVLCMAVLAFAFFRYFQAEIGAPSAAVAFLVPLLVPLRIPPIPEGPSFAFQFPIWSQFVQPWSTTPVAAYYAVVLLLVRGGESSRLWRDFLLGALAAATFATRPVDVLALIPVGATYLARLRTRDTPWHRLACGAAGIATVLVLFVIVTRVTHGTLRTPYITSNAGLSLSDIHERAIAILCDAGRLGRPGQHWFNSNPGSYRPSSSAAIGRFAHLGADYHQH